MAGGPGNFAGVSASLKTALNSTRSPWPVRRLFRSYGGCFMRLLVIEDESRIAEILRPPLEQAGFAVDFVHLCADGRVALASHAYDAAILDLGLPDGDGLDLLAELRARGDGTPILVLTARDTV